MGQITEESADDTLHAAIFAKLFRGIPPAVVALVSACRLREA